MASKFPEAEARLFKNKWVCKICKTVVKAPSMLVMAGKVKCRKCYKRKLRTLRKK